MADASVYVHSDKFSMANVHTVGGECCFVFLQKFGKSLVSFIRNFALG